MKKLVLALPLFAWISLLVGCAKELPNSKQEIKVYEGSLSSAAGKMGNNKFAVYKAEYITTNESDQLGQVIFFKNVGNKQLGDDFVPGDPRRDSRVNITYTIDQEPTTDNGLDAAQVAAAISASMKTWDDVQCSKLNLTAVSTAANLGFVSALLGFGGQPDFLADVQHSGFLPGGFFDALTPGGSNFILGVTFTLIWLDGNGNPTDIDGNGQYDVAFREIYYNDGFTWRTNSGSGFDIETVALHEAGHGLSQAHFGKGFRTLSNGKLHIAPNAVMNAAYIGAQRTLLGTDEAGHCSNWGNWPNN